VNIEALINELADPGDAGDEEEAIRDFTEACRRVDEDPREKQRYRDIADLIEVEDALYDQGVAALGRGDYDTAVPLLRLAAEKGIGDAAWLLAVTFDKRGETAEAITWYERAARDGDSRADAALGAHQARSVLAVRSDLVDHWGFDVAVLAEEAFRTEAQPRRGSLIAYTHTSRPEDCDVDFTWLPDATWHRPDEAAHFTGYGQRRAWFGADMFLPVRLRTWRLGPWPRLIAAEPAPKLLWLNACEAAGRADVQAVLTAGGLGRWLARESRTISCLAAAGAVFAAVLTDSGYAAPRCAEGQRSGVPPADGTLAGHVMIPPAAVPVLARGMTVDAALGEMLRSGEPTLPVGEGSAVAGVVTLADLAGSVRDSRGVPSIQRIEALMQPPIEVTMDTPLPEVRAAMARNDAGLVVVCGPAGGVVGYIMASSLLADSGTAGDSANWGQPHMEVPLLGPGGGTARICVS